MCIVIRGTPQCRPQHSERYLCAAVSHRTSAGPTKEQRLGWRFEGGLGRKTNIGFRKAGGGQSSGF